MMIFHGQRCPVQYPPLCSSHKVGVIHCRRVLCGEIILEPHVTEGELFLMFLNLILGFNITLQNEMKLMKLRHMDNMHYQVDLYLIVSYFLVSEKKTVM